MARGLDQRLRAPLLRAERRSRRALRRAGRRVRKRLKRNWWLRDSPLATSVTRARFALGLYFDDIERVLDALARDQRRVFVIQVGACEGAVGDPLGYFLRARRWTGILVEPVGYLFERMRHNLEGRPGVVLENAAIAPQEGERVFHYLEPREGDPRPGLHKTLGSFDRATLERHAHYFPDFASRVVSKPVRCMPLDALCERHRVERLDLLFCDAEGYDHEVLRTLDLERHRPRLLVWEHQHLAPHDAEACRRRVEAAGYAVRTLSKDTVALDRSREGGELGLVFRSLGVEASAPPSSEARSDRPEL